MDSNRRMYAYLLAVGALFLAHAVYLGCVAEDAYISFRFAKNLAAGHGLVWNVGEPPVEGYTNFLWVVLCSLALKLGLDLPIFSQIVGVLASLATMVYTFLFAHKLLRCTAASSLVPVLFLALSGPFVTWAMAGMEMNLYGLLVVMAVYHFASYWRSESRSSLWVCFAAVFGATLTRPEGLMVFAVLLGLGWLLSDGRQKKFIEDFSFPVIAYLLIFAAYFIWRVQYFGFLLPNTFYAKTTGGVYQYVKGAVYVGFFGTFFVVPMFLPLVLLLWEKGRPVALRGLGLRGLVQHMRSHAGFYTCLTLSLIYTLYIIYVGGDYMAMYRFFVPLLPLVYLLFAPGINALFVSAADSPRKRRVGRAVVAFAAGLIVLQSTPLSARLFRKPPWQHGHYEGVQLERWHVNRLSLIGEFFEGYKKSHDESVATAAIGAISYYADMKIWGFYGLVDSHIAHRDMTGIGKMLELSGHQKEDFVYLFSKRPTYFMFSRRLTQEPREFPDYKAFMFSRQLTNDPENAPDLNRIMRDNYKLTAVWLVDERNSEAGYFTFLELKDKAK